MIDGFCGGQVKFLDPETKNNNVVLKCTKGSFWENK